METCNISSRAIGFLQPALPYLGRALEAVFDEYSEGNPSGRIPLVIAENKLCANLLMEMMKSFQGYSPDVLNYTDVTGLPSTKQALASFMSKYVFGSQVVMIMRSDNYTTVCFKL